MSSSGQTPQFASGAAQSFPLGGEPRPVRMDVVALMDGILGRAGPMMHAIDPARVLSFSHGGPPVWSVGVVAVETPRPYGYALTYGLGHVVSPETIRSGIGYELAIAVEGAGPPAIWAVALLRHLARYVLTGSNELRVGDIMPCRAPITRIPFPPQHQSAMPDTALDSIVVTADPVIPSIATPHGTIEVRRLVGIDAHELLRLGAMRAGHRAAARAAVDPLLLTTV